MRFFGGCLLGLPLTELLEGFKICFMRVLTFVFLSVFAILVGHLIGKSSRHFCFKYCLIYLMVLWALFDGIMGTKNWNLNLFTFNIYRKIYIFRKLKSVLVTDS